jgi:hypothetical protein
MLIERRVIHGTAGNNISKRKGKTPQKAHSPPAAGPNVWKGRLRNATKDDQQLDSIGSAITETLTSSSKWSGRLRHRVQINSVGSIAAQDLDDTFDSHLKAAQPLHGLLSPGVLYLTIWLIEDGNYCANFDNIR